MRGRQRQQVFTRPLLSVLSLSLSHRSASDPDGDPEGRSLVQQLKQAPGLQGASSWSWSETLVYSIVDTQAHLTRPGLEFETWQKKKPRLISVPVVSLVLPYQADSSIGLYVSLYVGRNTLLLLPPPLEFS